MNLNNTSAPPRHEATQDNDQPPKYEDIFGQRPSNEIAIEIPSQNENPQIQIQQARMVQVTIGRPMMPSQTGNQVSTNRIRSMHNHRFNCDKHWLNSYWCSFHFLDLFHSI